MKMSSSSREASSNTIEEIGGAHWNGECFVFDQRVALDPELKETETRQCFVCQSPVTPWEQRSEQYVPGQSCPHCYRDAKTVMKEVISEREANIRELTSPLPGSVPYDNARPMNVPARFDRSTLLEFLCGLHEHFGAEHWRKECETGRVLYKDGPAAPDRIVRAGERYDHLYPATTEPDVNAEIEILFEDNSLVIVNKPAPLPMHPSGRFNRNSLLSILNEVYAPEILKPAHRLDANTSGVVVFSRTRQIAARVQPQFENRTARKKYLARVLGHPDPDRFRSDTPISTKATQAGLRVPDPDGLASTTEFTVLSRNDDGTSLLEVQPLTGRTNQIRLHLWDLGFPIVGDPAYLPDGKLGETQTLSINDPPLCLHAWETDDHASDETCGIDVRSTAAGVGTAVGALRGAIVSGCRLSRVHIMDPAQILAFHDEVCVRPADFPESETVIQRLHSIRFQNLEPNRKFL